MSPRLLRVLLVAVLGAAPSLAHADCTGPAGVAGQIIYNTTFSVMQYCNGTNWINMLTIIDTQDDGAYHHADLTIPGAALTGNFQVRVKSLMSAADDFVYIDDIQIAK